MVFSSQLRITDVHIKLRFTVTNFQNKRHTKKGIIRNLTFTTMKKIGIILVLTLILVNTYSQNTAILYENEKGVFQSDREQNVTHVTIGNDLISVRDSEEGVNLRIGNAEINILESLEGSKSLNMLRYGTTVRAGYSTLQLYGTYYFTPLFKTGKGPELYPFEVGVSFSFES